MLKRMKSIWQRYMLRPTIYKIARRVMICLCVCLAWDQFVNQGKSPAGLATSFLFMAMFLAVAGWMSYLKLDGMKVPQFDKKLFDWGKKPDRNTGDMADHMDQEPVVDYDDLEDDEQNLCLCIANFASAAGFLIASFF